MAAGGADEASEPVDALSARPAARAAIADNFLRHAEIHVDEGDLESALVAAEFAFRLDPGSARAAVALVRALRRKGDLERAAHVLQTRLHAVPECADLRAEQAWLAYDRRQWDAAVALFRALLDEQTTTPARSAISLSG